MEGFVESIMKDLNSNLATSKPLLAEMIDGGDRTYKVRDGSTVTIPEEQLQRLWDACEDSEKLRLRLPIYVSTNISGEGSAWKVDGRAEAAVIARMLGKRMYREDSVRLYHPDLKRLRSLIPDCIMITFTP